MEKKFNNTKQQKSKSSKTIKNKDNTLIQFIKKNWAILLAVLFMLMWMNKCSSSCSSERKVNKQTIMIDSLTTLNDTLYNALNYYMALYQMESKHNDNFKSVAVGNQNELFDKITGLEKDIKVKDEEIKHLKQQLDVLKKDNDELLKQIINE